MHAHPALNDSALQPAKFSPRKPSDSKPYPIPPRNPQPAHHIHQPASRSMLQFSQHIHYFIRDTTRMQQQALEHAVKERPQHLKQTNVWMTQLHLLIQFASQTSNIIFLDLLINGARRLIRSVGSRYLFSLRNVRNHDLADVKGECHAGAMHVPPRIVVIVHCNLSPSFPLFQSQELINSLELHEM